MPMTNQNSRSTRVPGRLRIQIVFLIAALFLSAFSLSRRLSAQEPAHSPGWVVLSIPDYRALRVKAYPAEREPEPPPVDATLSRVDYDLRVDSDLASGRATLTVDVLKNGWVRVPIPTGLFVREAKLDGKPLSLAPPTSREPNQLSALLSHPGRAVISLEIALPITSTAGEERYLTFHSLGRHACHARDSTCRRGPFSLRRPLFRKQGTRQQ